MRVKDCEIAGAMKVLNRRNEGVSDGLTCYTLMREYGKTPNGNSLNGAWVLRIGGVFTDYDQYRSDLVERNKLIM